MMFLRGLIVISRRSLSSSERLGGLPFPSNSAPFPCDLLVAELADSDSLEAGIPSTALVLFCRLLPIALYR